MASSFGVFQLVGEARRFVFSNLDVLRAHLTVIFPAVLLIELINNFGQSYGYNWIPFVTMIPGIYLYACFALSWHRASLTAPSADQAVNPFRWDAANAGFIKIFFAIAVLPFLVSIVLGGMIGGAIAFENLVLIVIASLIAIAASVYVFIEVIRLSFLLPARSVGVTLSLKEARTASRGLLWKILGAWIVIGLAFLGALFLYALVVGLAVGVTSADADPGAVMKGIMTFILSIPVIAAAMILMALNVTILSKAYQWGMQNNA